MEKKLLLFLTLILKIIGMAKFNLLFGATLDIKGAARTTEIIDPR